MCLLLSWYHLCEPLLFVSTRSAYTLYYALIIIIIIKPIQFNSTLKYASDFSDYFCCCQFVVEKNQNSDAHRSCFLHQIYNAKIALSPIIHAEEYYFSLSAKTQRCRTNDKLEQKHMVQFIFCTIN